MNHEWKREGKTFTLGKGMTQCYRCGLVRQTRKDYGKYRTHFLTKDLKFITNLNPGCSPDTVSGEPTSNEPRMSWYEQLMLSEEDAPTT